ncbi:MAG: circadian clock protein KaiC [Deltaproteobacteria bacterium]|nr:circadian clock protein KaiC [Deltaproteobacteria bacterium]
MPKNLEKAPTHIKGLDEILEGGLPRGRTTVINGGPGSGKTLLALAFLYRGALAGEPGIFIGFEEPVEHLRQNAATLGWDLSALEREKRLVLLGGHIKPDTLVSGDFSLKGLLAAASGKAREIGAKRIVIDALEVALRLFDDPRQVRNEMHLLNDWLQQAGLAAVLTTRPPKRAGASVYEDFFDSMGDCVIVLDVRVADQIATRRLRVVKYRGSGFGRNEYPYVITNTGIHTAPISTVGLRHKPLGEKITTGISRLDDILDGGYRRALCVLVAGIPGTGKTILCSTFVSAACERGEKVLYISFEESEDALVENVFSAGVALRPHIESGQLRMLASFPEAMGAEEHYIRALETIDDFSPAHVVVDAISACERMGGKQAALEYLMRLLNACKERGITILMVNQSASEDITEISGNNISSMVDTVISLAYKVDYGEITRLLHVLKSRGSRHSNQQREFVITDDGIQLPDVYLGQGEVLTGVARQVQEAKDRAEAERLDFDIQSKELELKRLELLRRQMANGVARRAAMRGEEASSQQRHEPAGSGEEG